MGAGIVDGACRGARVCCAVRGDTCRRPASIAKSRKESLSTSYRPAEANSLTAGPNTQFTPPYGSPYAVPTHIFSRAAVPLGGAARDGIVGLTIIGASVEVRVLPP